MRSVAQWILLLGALLLAATVPLTTAAQMRSDPWSRLPRIGPFRANRTNYLVSPVVLEKYWVKHPEAAPTELQPFYRMLQERRGGRTVGPAQPSLPRPQPFVPGPAVTLFNNDTVGWPQNEETVAACRGAVQNVLGGTNDYRGLWAGDLNFSGWHFSTTGGTLTKEGRLPALTIGVFSVPSGGDPVQASAGSGAACAFYYASLYYGPSTLIPSAVVVFRSTPTTLAGCPGGTASACWPTSKVVVQDLSGIFFYDKEWMAAGPDGSGGTQVAVTWTKFNQLTSDVAVEASICDGTLTTCTAPFTLDNNAANPTEDYLQFTYADIAPNGKVYVTWVYFHCPASVGFGLYCQGTVKGRIFTPGSGWGPVKVIAQEPTPIQQLAPFTSPPSRPLIGMQFRAAMVAKSAVWPIALGTRWMVVWDRCNVAASDPGFQFWLACPDANIRAAYSDNDGTSWTTVDVSTAAGHQFFATAPAFDPATNRILIAFYSTQAARAQDGYDSRYDVYIVKSPASGPISFGGGWGGAQRLTSRSSNPYAASVGQNLVTGRFIGDYFQAFADGGTYYVHFNAQYRQVGFDLGVPGVSPSLPAWQDDNWLVKGNM